MKVDDEFAIDLMGDLADSKRRSPAERRARKAKRESLKSALLARRKMSQAEKEAEAARLEEEVATFIASRPNLSPRTEKAPAL